MEQPKKKAAKARVQKVTQKQPEFIIHDLTLVSPDRSSKDMQSIKIFVQTAEQVHYPNRVGLYDMYHDIWTMDGHLRGIVGKRVGNVLNKRLLFKDKDGQTENPTTDLMRTKKGRDLLKLMMESKIWGVSGVEFVVGDCFEFKEIPRKHINPIKEIITKGQYDQSEANGYKYKEMPFVWVMGDKHDLGILLACSMYAIYKRGALGDFAQYVEIFGQPVRVMYYDAYDTQTKAELRKTLNESGSSLAMMIPKQAEFQMLDGKTSNADGKLQETLIRICNDEMSIAVLGNTETTSSSKSSGYAQSAEHADQQDILTAADIIDMENMLNCPEFMYVLESYGYDVAGGCFEYEVDLDLQKLVARLNIDREVSQIVPIDDDYWYNTYKLPKPKNYDELKAKMESKKNTVPTTDNPEPANPKTKKKEKSTALSEKGKRKFWREFRILLSDFFDPAQH